MAQTPAVTFYDETKNMLTMQGTNPMPAMPTRRAAQQSQATWQQALAQGRTRQTAEKGLAMSPMEICEKIVAEINRELNGRGEIDLAYVACILAGRHENESHPMTARVKVKLREHGL